MEVFGGSEAFRTGPPKLLANWPALLTDAGDIALDGERILLADRPADADNAPINVVTNWTAVLDESER